MKANLVVLAAIGLVLPLGTAYAEPDIDPAISQELKKVAATYGKLGRFTLTSLETSQENVSTSRLRCVGRFANDGRRFLKVEKLHSGGNPKVKLARLYANWRLTEARRGRPKKEQRLTDLMSNPTLLTNFFRESDGLSVVQQLLDNKGAPVLTTGLETGDVESVTYELLPLSGGRKRIEYRTKSTEYESTVYGLLRVDIAPNGLLQRVYQKVDMEGDTIYQSDAKLSKPSLLPEKNAFNWKTLAPKFTSSISIAPQVKVAFNRAAKLYKGAKSYSAELQTKRTSSYEGLNRTVDLRARLAFDTKGHLRYESPIDETVAVVDGKVSWLLDGEEFTKEEAARTPSRANLLGYLDEATGEGGDLGGASGYIVQFLNGNGKVADLADYSEFKAAHFANRKLGNTPCDLVIINSLMSLPDQVETDDGEDEIDDIPIDTSLWFARDNGRLMRVTVNSRYTHGLSFKSDVVFLNQRFNPATFPAATWKFVPPKGAVETKDED